MGGEPDWIPSCCTFKCRTEERKMKKTRALLQRQIELLQSGSPPTIISTPIAETSDLNIFGLGSMLYPAVRRSIV
jgi:hypothetical protein